MSNQTMSMYTNEGQLIEGLVIGPNNIVTSMSVAPSTQTLATVTTTTASPAKRLKLSHSSSNSRPSSTSNSQSVFEQETQRIEGMLDDVPGNDFDVLQSNAALNLTNNNNNNIDPKDVVTETRQGKNGNVEGGVIGSHSVSNTISSLEPGTKGSDGGLNSEVIAEDPKQPPFIPENYKLNKNFRLMTFSNSQGLKPCKLSLKEQPKVLESGVSEYSHTDQDPALDDLKLKPGVDVSILALRHSVNLIKSMEIAYPPVDDPYIAGRIACIQTLSGLHALGLFEITNVLMILYLSSRLKKEEQDVVAPLVIKGFADAAKEAGTGIQGGQTIFNPWIAIGGIATAVSDLADFVLPISAVAGDFLILTKPLGTYEALTAHELLMEDKTNWNKLKKLVLKTDMEKAYKMAVSSMGQHNFHAAKLMRKYEAHAGTEIGEYGLLGHAEKLVQHQQSCVSFDFYNLPILAKMDKVAVGINSGLLKGTSCEISGGLLIALPAKNAPAFMKELGTIQGSPSWIVGVVNKGNSGVRSTTLAKNVRLLQVYCHGQVESSRSNTNLSVSGKIRV